jgi:hypothetical protein
MLDHTSPSCLRHKSLPCRKTHVQTDLEYVHRSHLKVWPSCMSSCLHLMFEATQSCLHGSNACGQRRSGRYCRDVEESLNCELGRFAIVGIGFCASTPHCLHTVRQILLICTSHKFANCRTCMDGTETRETEPFCRSRRWDACWVGWQEPLISKWRSVTWLLLVVSDSEWSIPAGCAGRGGFEQIGCSCVIDLYPNLI